MYVVENDLRHDRTSGYPGSGKTTKIPDGDTLIEDKVLVVRTRGWGSKFLVTVFSGGMYICRNGHDTGYQCGEDVRKLNKDSFRPSLKLQAEGLLTLDCPFIPNRR